jgi:hypothetical protein
MNLKARLRFVWALLAVVAAGAVAIDVGSFALPAHGAKQKAHTAAAVVCPASHESDPLQAAAHFVHSAVQRADLKGSYDLAAPSLRKGVSCAEWVRGQLPVGKVPDVDWNRSGYQVVTARASEVMLRIVLVRKSGGSATYLIDVQKHGGGWKVGKFEPVPPSA